MALFKRQVLTAIGDVTAYLKLYHGIDEVLYGVLNIPCPGTSRTLVPMPSQRL